MTDIFEKLPEALLGWYEQNKRQLPWREDRDPYHIWLSEIMLQQTRVEAITPDFYPQLRTLRRWRMQMTACCTNSGRGLAIIAGCAT